MKRLVVLGILALSGMAFAAEKPPCAPYVWGGPTPTDCVVVTYPAPYGGTIDMADWMPMDATLRDRFHMEPGTLGSHVVNNKIIYTKFDTAGNYADVWTFDEDYIYFYTTYGPPNGGVRGDRAGSQTANPWLPRYAQLGMPGVRLVSEGATFQPITDCEAAPAIPSTNTITELWGPFSLFDELGDAMQYVSMRNYWDCHGVEPESCTQLEDYWYMKPYGWINWTAYEAASRDGNFIQVNGGTLWGPVAGGTTLKDWCLSPSLLGTPPKPVSYWPSPAAQKRYKE